MIGIVIKYERGMLNVFLFCLNERGNNIVVSHEIKEV